MVLLIAVADQNISGEVRRRDSTTAGRVKEARFTNVPSAALPITTLATGFITVLLPLTPIGHVLGFEPLSPLFLLALIGILFAYVLTAELTKEQFYAKGQREVGSA